MEDRKKTGLLIFPDHSFFVIDESQRLIGRSDLEKFTNDNPIDISRSHFTIYLLNEKYYVEDGITNVQDKSSKNGTFVNNTDIKNKGKFELVDEIKIKVSDVIMNFRIKNVVRITKG